MSETPSTDAPETDEPLPGERQTRLSGAWTAIVIGLVALVVILVFILQNQATVEVTFLVFLVAVIVVAFGAARILQLRMVAGRARRKAPTPSKPE